MKFRKGGTNEDLRPVAYPSDEGAGSSLDAPTVLLSG